ncbi:MAG: oligosaccharide flippase family protein [Dehalococcoidia bacterium]|jgi:O-antigen/teichoic acid export membrane protein
MEADNSETNNYFEIRAFGKDALIYSLSYALGLIISFIQVYIIAKYLPITDFGYWQIFMLYSTYVGILSLGFTEGILMRWGGKKLDQISDEIGLAFKFLVLEQTILVLCLGLFLYFMIQPYLQPLVLLLMAFAFIFNLTLFLNFTSQAIKRFKLLAAINAVRGLLFLIFTLFLIFLLHYPDYQYIIAANILSYILLFLALYFCYWRYFWGNRPLQTIQISHKSNVAWKNILSRPKLKEIMEFLGFSSTLSYGTENIKLGFYVLLGNFGVTILLTLDRLMVNSFFSIEHFAIYAFASMVVIVIYTMVKAISDVFFPYLPNISRKHQENAYSLGQSIIILAAAATLSIYFPFAKLVDVFLPQYVASLNIIKILLCSIGFGSLAQIVHINYYKLLRKQRHYFLVFTLVLIISSISILFAIRMWGTLESVAIALLISFIIWYVLFEMNLRSTVGGEKGNLLKVLAFFICYVSAFWVSSILVEWFIAQMIIYLCLFLVLSWLFYRRQIMELADIFHRII